MSKGKRKRIEDIPKAERPLKIRVQEAAPSVAEATGEPSSALRRNLKLERRALHKEEKDKKKIKSKGGALQQEENDNRQPKSEGVQQEEKDSRQTKPEGGALQQEEKKRKRKEKKEKINAKSHDEARDGNANSTTSPGQKQLSKQNPTKTGGFGKEKPEPESKSDLDSIESAWEISEPVGGHRLNRDPIFSRDEQYLIVPYGTYVAIYAISTSLLVRRLQTRTSICGLALHPLSDDQIYVALESGFIQAWNWKEGAKLGYWRTSSQIFDMTAANDLLYVIDRRGKGRWNLSAHRLSKKSTEVATLLKWEEHLAAPQVVNDGKAIIMKCGAKLVMGTSKSPSQPNLKDVEYRWQVFECPEEITSMDVKVRDKSIDIVVGGAKGSINTYENMIGNLRRKESEPGAQISTRRSHWHRNRVLALKYSRDGNYVISGGLETVLVISNLETNHRETLPHLGCPITSLVVSPTGSSYAVQLADQSTMVLSTSNLSPLFSVSSVHVPLAGDRSYSSCVMQQQGTDKLLMAVPSYTEASSQVSHSATELQMCDISTGQEISRQALTRNHITAINIAPDGHMLEDPHISHMQISGNWLATVEEWIPPIEDYNFHAYDDDQAREKQARRREGFLKFWSWNGEQWELNSRIDRPHTRSDTSVCSHILDLAAVPYSDSPCFATISTDGDLKIWEPKTRKRDGLPAKGSDGLRLASWRCHSTTNLGTGFIPTAKLAYSADASIIAVAPTSHPIFLADTSHGGVSQTLTNLSTGDLHGICISGQYLVVLSSHLVIFDLVTLNVQCHVDLALPSLRGIRSRPEIAVDHIHNTFALALPRTERHPNQTLTALIVYSTETLLPIHASKIENEVSSLLPAQSRKAFYVITQGGEIRTLRPRPSFAVKSLGSRSTPLKSQRQLEANTDEKPKRGLDNIFGAADGVSSMLSMSQSRRVNEEDGEREARFVSRERLAEVFSAGTGGLGSALALPPVTVLFERVAKLYNGRLDT